MNPPKGVDEILSELKTQLFKFIDTNGYHRGYNPSYQAEFINQLPISKEVKDELHKITPKNYLGNSQNQ